MLMLPVSIVGLSNLGLGPRLFDTGLFVCPQMDVGKFWRDIHHPRSPRAPYFSTLLLTGTPGAAAGGAASAAEVYAAAVQYLQSVEHTEWVSGGSRHRDNNVAGTWLQCWSDPLQTVDWLSA